MIRSLGQNPTESDLQKMINENDEDGNGIIDFEEFTGMMSKRLKEFNYEEDMRQSYTYGIVKILSHFLLFKLSLSLRFS